MSDLQPLQSRYFDHGGLRMHSIDDGLGEPVVMVHGNPTWSFYYRHLALALRDTHRVIVPDHIGCGLSDKPDDTRYRYTLDRRVDDLEALLENFGVDDGLTLVLHDWGGMIGMAYATRHPGRIRRLVIFNTAAFRLPSTKSFPLALRLVRSSPVGPLLVRGLNAFCRGTARIGCRRHPMSRAVRAGYLRPYDSWANRIAVQRFVEDIPLQPGDAAWDTVLEVEEGLPRFAGLPVLICWGERDFVFDGRFLDGWRTRFPDAEVHRFADCGHYILEDAAAEIVPLVQHFLATHPTTAGAS